jgi:hypothetical protein
MALLTLVGKVQHDPTYVISQLPSAVVEFPLFSSFPERLCTEHTRHVLVFHTA